MATYTFYMGPHVTGYLTDTGDGYYTCEITGYGDMYESSYYFTVPPGQIKNWAPERIHQTVLIVPAGVTSIAHRCFDNLGVAYALSYTEPGVESVILPESLLRIGGFAFGVHLYYRGLRTKYFTFGHNIEYIGEEAFIRQTAVQQLDFHDNPGIVVEDGAFAFCHNLEYVGLPDDWSFGHENSSHGLFEDCYNLSRISPKNVIHHITGSYYKNCNRLGSVCIMDTARYTTGAASFYVDLFAGDNCDEEGYFITEVDPDSVVEPLVVAYDWKNNWHRIVSTKLAVYLYHMGRIVTIKCYDSGDIPLKHEDIWYFLKWVRLNGKNFNPGQSPLFVTHRGHWYQISY